ncbi:FxsA family protein [Alysiella filiformis]|uniref:UPF0716 protein FxsA n=1 Tax=Alysiella filiformis DSM 16848 TaxID=1120981 RepID=A0A286EJR1_9NEIS|nr:FxsA family protein [Alysiella filiformis]QMT30703.1 FxsA family protein [Alysiella filiformis]UBQ56317.1 FxsA family protein [Alysiella filiformis DSM 16848]SOD71171.1 UPF0716 protein FxsA [Alysiella filiformis DSM 16848]
MQFVGIFFFVAFILEILSIVFVGKLLGGLATFGLMILSAMLGAFLLRNMGNISKVILAGGVLKNGTVSWYELLLPIRVPVAGLLLILPGFLSDVLALLLLIPFSGKAVATPNSQSHFSANGFQYHKAKPDDDVIEGDFVVRDANGNAQAKQSQKNQDVIEHRP